MTPRLPKVIVSNVVRAANKGERHGEVRLVDLAEGTSEQVLDCAATDISWEGSGGERGLRGMVCHDGRILLASHRHIHIYDQSFRLLGEITNPYLGQIHELSVHRGILWITSTSFDSVLGYDLAGGRFRQGYCLRPLPRRVVRSKNWVRRLVRTSLHRFDLPSVPAPRLHCFDPEAPGGPERGDQYHINNVFATDEALFISAGGFNRLLAVKEGGRLEADARIPIGTHNARPLGDGSLVNDTLHDRGIVHYDRRGRRLANWPPIKHDHKDLEMGHLPDRKARAGWARGLCLTDDGLLIGGSSPATIAVYDFHRRQLLRTVNLTRDIRYAVHGLALWPW